MHYLLLILLVPNLIFAQDSPQKLANKYFLSHDYEKAVNIYIEMEKNFFSSNYYSNYFFALVKLEKYKEAERLARKAYSKYYKNLIYQLDIGIAQKKQGKEKQAERTFEKVFSKINGQRSQAIVLANTFARYNMYQEALNVYNIFQEVNPKLTFGFQKAQLYVNLEQPEKMVEEYLNVIGNNASQKTYVISQIQKFLDNDGIKSDKNYKIVKRALLKYVSMESDNVYYSELLIWFFMQNQQYEMALKQAISLDKRKKNNADAVFDLAESFLDKKNYLLAIEAYNYILKKGKNNPLFIQSTINSLYAKTKNIGFVQNHLNNIDKEYAVAINDLGKNSETILLLLNYAHFQAFFLDNLILAENILKEALSIPNLTAGDLAACKIEYADIQLLLGDVWQALLFYSQVEKDFKENPIGHNAKLKIAKISYYQGDFEWAQAQLDVLKASTSKLISNDAMDLSLLITDNYNIDTSDVPMKTFAYADMLLYQKKYKESIIKYDSILMYFPGHSLTDEIYMRKADIYLHLDSINSALKMYKKIEEEWSHDILADEALYMQASIYDNKLNKPEIAMSFYENIVLNYQGSIYASEARNRFRFLRDKN